MGVPYFSFNYLEGGPSKVGIDLLSQVRGQEETTLNCVRGDLDWIPGKISSLLMQILPCSSCFFCVKVLKIKIKFLWGLLIWGFFNPLKMKAPVRFPHFRKMKFHKYFQGAILRRAEVSQCCTSEVKVSVQAPERRNLGAMVMGAFI